MNPIRSWVRRAYPRDGIAFAFVSVILITEGAWLATGRIAREFGAAINPTMQIVENLAESLHYFNIVLILVGLTLLAIWRVWAFHPLCQVEYRRWLQSTPWNVHLPLPNGPVHLTLQDVLVLLTGTLVMWGLHPEIPPFHVVLLFLFIYEAVLAASMALLKMRRHAYAAAFGLGLVVALWSERTIVWSLLAAAVVYLDLQIGLKRALAQIEDWGETLYDPIAAVMSRQDERTQKALPLGWPLDLLRPDLKYPAMAVVDGLLLSLLAGWWTNALFAHIETAEKATELMRGMMLVLSMGALSRVAMYAGKFAPPLSFLGRIFNGRWIIPGYDRILVMPLLSIAIFSAFGWAQRHFNLDPWISASCMVTASLAPLLLGGPGLRAWQLTGEHRLTPVLSSLKTAGMIRLP